MNAIVDKQIRFAELKNFTNNLSGVKTYNCDISSLWHYVHAGAPYAECNYLKIITKYNGVTQTIDDPVYFPFYKQMAVYVRGYTNSTSYSAAINFTYQEIGEPSDDEFDAFIRVTIAQPSGLSIYLSDNIEYLAVGTLYLD